MKTNIVPENSVKLCEKFLNRDRKYNVDHSTLRSEVKVIDRLFNNSNEMRKVYQELGETLNEQAVWTFLRLLLSTTAFWHPDANQEARDKKRRLIDVNSLVAEKASELAILLREREELNNSSGFYGNTHYDICEVIEKSAKKNYYFTSYVQDKLSILSQDFDLKYWPSIPEVVDEISSDSKNANVIASDPLTSAATASCRNSLTDYFKALFASIEENSMRHGGFIPRNFRLSDSSLATLANCALDLSFNSIVDAQYVKRLRQRIRENKGSTSK